MMWTTQPFILLLCLRVEDGQAFGRTVSINIHSPTISSTALGISKQLAQKIDEYYYYQEHKKEVDEKAQQRILQYLDPHLPMGLDAVDLTVAALTPTQRVRDTKLVMKNPKSYCQDRCLATGFCDIFEDVFEFSQEEARQFCSECIISDEEDHLCDVPEGSVHEYYNKLLEENRKKGFRL
mmetsp:Transcript_35958/g.70767  ORF Transcript_35958/g.70767 Transcript_35958/m.70767 type:complete len:180 (-) Transcript_35958:241-780(-)